jgi:hypothetical protein
MTEESVFEGPKYSTQLNKIQIILWIRSPRSRDRAADSGIGYGPHEQRSGVQVHAEEFVQTGFIAHLNLYAMATSGSFQGLKWTVGEADHLPLIGAYAMQTCIYTSTPPIRLYGVELSQFSTGINFIIHEEWCLLGCYAVWLL